MAASENGGERWMSRSCLPSRTVTAASDIFAQRKEEGERERERMKSLLEMRN